MTTTILFLLAVNILVIYTAFIVIKFGVLPSFSDSWYALQKVWSKRRKKYINISGVFQVVLGTVAVLMAVVMFDLTHGLWWQFVSFLTAAPLVFVAAAPDFKTGGLATNTHKYAAILSGVFSIAWVILASTSIAPNVWINIPVMAMAMGLAYYGNSQQNGLWWAEYACFMWTICGIAVALWG